jgi:site-specific DNA recombinase
VQALSAQEAQLRNDAVRQQQLAGVAASLEAFRARVQGGLAQASFEQRRQLVMLLVDRVVVTDAEVEIRYVLPTSPESEHVRFCQLRKDYFDALADALAHGVAPMPGRTPVDGRAPSAGVLSHMGRHPHGPQQLLRRDRGPPDTGVKRRELALQSGKRLVHNGADRA